MIYRAGEFVRMSHGDWAERHPDLHGAQGRYGQIYRIEDLDNSKYPYTVILVLANGETIKFRARQEEMKYFEYNQIEFEEDFIFYMKMVKR